MRRTVLALPLICLSFAGGALAGPPGSAPSPAAASDSGVAKTDPSVAAQALFDESLDLIKAGKWPEACAKLEASNRLAWAPGTTLNLADCYEHVGRLASAWVKFLESEPHFQSRTPPDPRAEIAKKRAEALVPKLARLKIEVGPNAGVTGLVVRRDGDVVESPEWGTGVPVDPGKHVLEVSAPGKKPWRWEGTVSQEGATVTVPVPALEGLPPPPPPPSGTATAGAAGDLPAARKAAIGLAAGGVAGLVVGGIFGGIAAGKVGDSNKTCPVGEGGVRQCDHAGAVLRADANTMANVSNVGFIAGAALVAAGVVVWFVGPSGEEASDTKAPTDPAKSQVRLGFGAGPAGGFVQVNGRF